MLKLSVITDEFSQDFRRVIAFAREFDLQGLEIRSVWDTPVEKLTLEQIHEMRNLLAGTELVICSIASPFLKCDIDDHQQIDEHVRMLGRCIEIAEHLGCDIVRTFTFWKNGSLNDRLDRIVEIYQRALFLAMRTGVRLAVENEDSTTVGTGEELAALIERLDSPLVRACWDPQNDFYRTGGTRDYRPGYAAVRAHTIHVHLKDARVNPDSGQVENEILGQGGVNVQGQIEGLVRDGYRGFVSLETHWRPASVPARSEDVDVSRFADVAEYATWLCMRNLRSMVEGATS